MHTFYVILLKKKRPCPYVNYFSVMVLNLEGKLKKKLFAVKTSERLAKSLGGFDTVERGSPYCRGRYNTSGALEVQCVPRKSSDQLFVYR